MKTRYLIVLLCLFTCTDAFAQSVGINSDGSAPDGSAMLDIKSTTGGLLIPRLTSGEKLRLHNPAAGLMVYQLDDSAFYYYNGKAWLHLNGLVNTLNELSFTGNDTGFVATIENANGNTGDGLKIKLGKLHPKWNAGANKFYNDIEGPNIAYINTVRTDVINLISGGSIGTSPTDLLNLWPNSVFAGVALQLVNIITPKLNDALNLPVTIGPYKYASVEVVPKITVVPFIPQISSPFPGIDFGNLDYSIFDGSVDPKVLSNTNEFIRFVDKDDRKLGEIRAEATQEWRNNYFSDLFIAHTMAALVGIDFAKDLLGIEANLDDLTDAFNNLGIEYNSGHGDYAEWLERINENEALTAGDIVGVRGGKITKDLQNAEQVMVVSYQPIMLGNVPIEGKENKGNKVAFMGQVPVKVMGAVKTGDYIVAKGSVPGYGIAVGPAAMTFNDYKMCVGRAWVQNLNPGPKTVNTLVGIDNGNYVKILQNNQRQIKDNEQKLQDVTNRLIMLENTINSLTGKNTMLKTKLD